MCALGVALLPGADVSHDVGAARAWGPANNATGADTVWCAMDGTHYYWHKYICWPGLWSDEISEY